MAGNITMNAIEEEYANENNGDLSIRGNDDELAIVKVSRGSERRLQDSIDSFSKFMLSQKGLNANEDMSPGADSEVPSESEEETGFPTIANNIDEEGSPEAITRKDTRVLQILRCVSICIVLLVAAFVVAFIFRYTNHTEEEDFENDFAALGANVVETFLVATRAKFMMARSVAQYMSSLPEDTLPSLSHSQFESIVRPQQVSAQARAVAWSPVLNSMADREAFEQLFLTTEELSPAGPYPACLLCGTTGRGFSNTDDVVSLPGFGASLTCGTLDRAGRDGEIPSSDCDFVSSVSAGLCTCNALESISQESTLPPGIWRLEDGEAIPEVSEPPYHPIGLQSALQEGQASVLFNQLSDPIRSVAIEQMVEGGFPALTETFVRDTDYYKRFAGVDGPALLLFFPLWNADSVVGSIASEFSWESFVEPSNLPPKSDLVHIVVVNSCGQKLTFQAIDDKLHLVGNGDLHEEQYSDMIVSSSFHDFNTLVRLSAEMEGWDQAHAEVDYCRYRFEVYPTSLLRNEYISNQPRLYATFAAAFFGITFMLFVLYDCFVRRRQQKLLKGAKQSTALIASLFPKAVRDRLIEDKAVAPKMTRRASFISSMASLTFGETSKSSNLNNSSNFNKSSNFDKSMNLDKAVNFNRSAEFDFEQSASPTKSFVNELKAVSKPIAELFPKTTVMFLDLAGFTAWSSEREPEDVFLLLETIYQSFDDAAARKGVFKIETIGDCYVAVTGVPDPMTDHAVVMARFAQECMKRMDKLTKQLEMQLGYGTAELSARVGLHSGSVTGGVLRGERARFQLFGDTMNTAARMESTGQAGYIQASAFTADLLVEAGKQHWVTPRPELVTAKGKGQMQTYWINPGIKRTTATSRSNPEADDLKSEISSGSSPCEEELSFGKNLRLIEWNLELLFAQLQKIVQARQVSGSARPRTQRVNSMSSLGPRLSRHLSAGSLGEDEAAATKGRGGILEEFSEIIDMPKFDSKAARKASLNDDMQVEMVVRDQLREYIIRISSMYRDVPFHNFEHASHVAMAASKLLKRLVSSKDSPEKRPADSLRQVHSQTFGISSDPLLQFTLIFAALIHDVDHSGLTNSELVMQRTPAAIIYKNRSVAEQNSLDVAWKVLMDEDFTQLRDCIYTNKYELKRFRQLLVNAMLATDLADTQTQTRRNVRWEKAFENETDDLDRRSSHRYDLRNDSRATVLFELVIQASDVAHTIQHWQTFSKFNERLFKERFAAFLNGVEERDPSETWYEDELSFFDGFVLPMANKLKSCGVFGSTGDEFMRWAQQNRAEWAVKGKYIVRHMREAALSQNEKDQSKERKRRS